MSLSLFESFLLSTGKWSKIRNHSLVIGREFHPKVFISCSRFRHLIELSTDCFIQFQSLSSKVCLLHLSMNLAKVLLATKFIQVDL